MRTLLADAMRLDSEDKLDGATRAYEEALAIDPASGTICSNLGTLYKRQGRMADAIFIYRRAVELEPTLTAAWYNLGLILYESWQLDDAAGAFWQALSRAHEAQAGGYLSPLCTSQALTLQTLGQHPQARAFLHEASQRFPEISDACARCALFSLNFSEDTGPAEVLREHRIWAERHADPLTHAASRFPPHPAADRPLRVGYVSGDFRSHPTASFVSRILQHHDRSWFDVYCYDNSPHSDSMSDRLRRPPSTWRDIRDMGDDAVVHARRQLS